MKQQSTSIQPYSATLVARTKNWSSLAEDELKRRCAEAARDRDKETLWAITEAHMTLIAGAGAKISRHTLSIYRSYVYRVIDSASGISLLQPPKNWGHQYLRDSEASGVKPATVVLRLSAARALWAAMRWAEATDADPFKDARAMKDKTNSWEKRESYPSESVEALVAQAADARELAMVLLGAHGGLRIAEMCSLTYEDLNLSNSTLQVTGKGNKTRTVPLSTRLVEALQRLLVEQPVVNGIPLLDLYPHKARRLLRKFCARAGVEYQAFHSLRHSAGERLYEITKDIVAVADHFGHASLDTSRGYAKRNRQKLAAAVKDF